MNPVLWFRDQLGQVSQALQDEMDQLVANIGTGWAAQHDDQGGHTTVTCSGACTCQQVKLRGFITLNLAQVSSTPLDIPAGIAYVTIVNGTGYSIAGLRQVGQQIGDQLYLRVDPSTAASLALTAKAGFATTPQGTELAFSSNQANAAYPAFNVLAGGGWVPFIYSPGDGTNGQNAWTMVQVVGKP